MKYSEARREWTEFCDKYIEDNVEDKDRHLFEEGGFHNEFWYGFVEAKFHSLVEANKQIEDLKAWMIKSRHLNNVEFTCGIPRGESCTCGLQELLQTKEVK